MVTRLQRWGNSLAVRIPSAFAAQAQLAEDSHIEITVEGDRIIVSPARKTWDLEELVEAITPHNRHGEVEWGKGRGKEAW